MGAVKLGRLICMTGRTLLINVTRKWGMYLLIARKRGDSPNACFSKRPSFAQRGGISHERRVSLCHHRLLSSLETVNRGRIREGDMTRGGRACPQSQTCSTAADWDQQHDQLKRRSGSVATHLATHLHPLDSCRSYVSLLVPRFSGRRPPLFFTASRSILLLPSIHLPPHLHPALHSTLSLPP